MNLKGRDAHQQILTCAGSCRLLSLEQYLAPDGPCWMIDFFPPPTEVVRFWRFGAIPNLDFPVPGTMPGTDQGAQLNSEWLNGSINNFIINSSQLFVSWQSPNCHFNLCFSSPHHPRHPCLRHPTRSQCNLPLRAILVIFWAPGHFIVGPKAHFSQLWAPSCIPGLDRLFTESVPP